MKDETFIGIRDFGTHKAAEFRLKYSSWDYGLERYEDIIRRDLPSLRTTIENAKKYNSDNLGELQTALRALQAEQ